MCFYHERILDTSIPQNMFILAIGGIIYIQVDRVAMRWPLGPVLANIFMTELEIAMIPSLRNCLQKWKPLVDDTFAFVLPDKIAYIVSQPNSFDENVTLPLKWNKLEFFDLMIIRNTNDTINTTVYRKPTNTDIYINWHSHSPLQWKKTTANVLVYREIKICSDKKVVRRKTVYKSTKPMGGK